MVQVVSGWAAVRTTSCPGLPVLRGDAVTINEQQEACKWQHFICCSSLSLFFSTVFVLHLQIGKSVLLLTQNPSAQYFVLTLREKWSVNKSGEYTSLDESCLNLHGINDFGPLPDTSFFPPASSLYFHVTPLPYTQLSFTNMLKNKQPSVVSVRATMQQQHLASARNRRLAQQMENRPSVQAALHYKQVRNYPIMKPWSGQEHCRVWCPLYSVLDETLSDFFMKWNLRFLEFIIGTLSNMLNDEAVFDTTVLCLVVSYPLSTVRQATTKIIDFCHVFSCVLLHDMHYSVVHWAQIAAWYVLSALRYF